MNTISEERLKLAGATMRRKRELRGISLRRFAKTVGLSPSYLSKMERGEAQAGAATYELIATAHGINEDALTNILGIPTADAQWLFVRAFTYSPKATLNALKRITLRREDG